MKRGTELICEGRHTVVDDYNPSTGEVLLLFEDGSEEWAKPPAPTCHPERTMKKTDQSAASAAEAVTAAIRERFHADRAYNEAGSARDSALARLEFVRERHLAAVFREERLAAKAAEGLPAK